MSFSIYLNLIILSIVQGLTEWLPISSSGILVVLEELINFKDKNLNLLFNISVHTGSLIAVMLFFKKDILNILNNLKLAENIIIATIPVVIFGLLVKILNINFFLQNIKVVAIATIFFRSFYISRIKLKFRKNLIRIFQTKMHYILDWHKSLH